MLQNKISKSHYQGLIIPNHFSYPKDSLWDDIGIQKAQLYLKDRKTIQSTALYFLYSAFPAMALSTFASADPEKDQTIDEITPLDSKGLMNFSVPIKLQGSLEALVSINSNGVGTHPTQGSKASCFLTVGNAILINDQDVK